MSLRRCLASTLLSGSVLAGCHTKVIVKNKVQPIIVSIRGQSNTGPGGLTTDLTGANTALASPIAAIKYRAQIGTNADPPGLVVYSEQSLAPLTYLSQAHLAFEMQLGSIFNISNPGLITEIDKVSLVGSSLATQWNNAAYPSTGPALRDISAQQMVDTIAATGVKRVICIWGQGESDAGGSGTAAAYAANFATMAAYLRAYVTAVYPTATISFVILRLNTDYRNAAGVVSANVDTLRAQQALIVANEIAAGHQSILIDQDSVSPQASDHTHYLADGYCTIGKLIAVGIASMLGIDIKPVAAWSFSTAGLTVNTTDLSTDLDGTVVSWDWNWGDGNHSGTQNASHTYSVGGTYTVTETTTDNRGASSSKAQSISVSAAGYTLDATSHLPIPLTASEWTAFLASVGDTDGNPTSLYYHDDVDNVSVTTVPDRIGPFPLTISGTGLAFQQPESGWASRSTTFTDNGTGSLSTTSASQTDLSTADELVFMWCRVDTAALRSVLSLGTPASNAARVEQRAALDRLQITTPAGTVNGANSPYSATPQLIALQVTATGSISTIYTQTEKIVGTWSASYLGKRFIIGNGFRTCPHMGAILTARFTAAAARRTSTKIKALFVGLTGSTPPWS